MSETISLENIAASQLRLNGEDVLVRPSPVEEVRASGLHVPTEMQKAITGGVWYGTVVATGPGRLVERGPSAESIAAFVRDSMTVNIHPGTPLEWSMRAVSEAIARYMDDKATEARSPLPWKPGDTVAVRQGFGVEVVLREGRHWIVGRGALEHGHGILCAWTPEHTHCWHAHHSGSCYGHGHEGLAREEMCRDSQGRPVNLTHCDINMGRCACGTLRAIETRLPSCVNCPPGERLAEAALGHEVYRMKIESGQGAGFFEERPVDDGLDDV